MSARPTFANPDAAAAAGYYSPDWDGSLDQWIDIATRTLVDMYIAGDIWLRDQLNSASGFGVPRPEDWGSGADGKNGTVSVQTINAIRNYVRGNLNNPWFHEKFGPPPERGATWTTPDLTREDRLAEAERDRQNQLAVAKTYAGATIQAAQIQADAQIQSTQIRAQTDWAIANLQAMTDRYIAEGNWAVQRELAYMQEQGLMTRFMLELGLKEKALAQEAIAERNRHHVAMMSLITEIAKYDAQMAAEPRNWLAYAAWLQNRGEVVNGLTLTTAAMAIPESEMDPGELVNTPAGMNLGGGIVVANIINAQGNGITVSGVGINVGSPGESGTEGAGSGQQGQAGGFQFSGQQGGVEPGQGAGYPQYSYNGIDLTGTDYTQIANQILGISGNQAPTTQQLQEAYNSVNAAGGNVDTSGYWSGPTTNKLGVTVNPLGHKNKWKQFASLLPSQQEMNVGAASSVGRPDRDYMAEFAKALPKGGAKGAAQYG